MALFQKQTKTRCSCEKGTLEFKKFKAPASERYGEGLSIRLTNEKGVKFSISLYGEEIGKLESAIKVCPPNPRPL